MSVSDLLSILSRKYALNVPTKPILKVQLRGTDEWKDLGIAAQLNALGEVVACSIMNSEGKLQISILIRDWCLVKVLLIGLPYQIDFIK